MNSSVRICSFSTSENNCIASFRTFAELPAFLPPKLSPLLSLRVAGEFLMESHFGRGDADRNSITNGRYPQTRPDPVRLDGSSDGRTLGSPGTLGVDRVALVAAQASARGACHEEVCSVSVVTSGRIGH